MRRLLFRCASLLLLAACAERPSGAPETPPPRRLRGRDIPAGRVVYQRTDGIYRVDLPSGEPVRLAEGGTWPRFSPDGTSVAFLHEHRIMVVSAEGGVPEEMARAQRGRALAWHPAGREIFFTDGSSLQTVHTDDRTVRTVLTGVRIRELGFSADGMRLAATVRTPALRVRAFDLHRGETWTVGPGCSASLSPDGEHVTNNSGDHRMLLLRDWRTGRIQGHIDAPPGRTFDNQYWSNHPEWIVSVSEGDRQDVYLHHVPTNRYRQITRDGDGDRPDLFVP